MTGDATFELVYYSLLLVVIGGAMVFELAGRGGRALRQLVLWAVIFAGATLAASWWMDRNEPRQQVLAGDRIEIPAGRDGHFQLTARVNGVNLDFMVDTGASSIALGAEDARRIGLDPAKLRFDGTAMTANGRVPTARVTLDTIAIGDIIDQDVRAVVINTDLGRSLLGMSYLRTFARVSFEGEMLILER